MRYTKRPLSIPEQVEKLKLRGLLIDDEQSAEGYLSNISYYRLRAYTFPFQENDDTSADHRFLRNDIHFSDIIDLYCFDRRLRFLMFNAIEKIEIAVRTKIVQVYAEATGDSHWFANPHLYNNIAAKDKQGKTTTRFALLMDEIAAEVKRSTEDFVKHYNHKYGDPVLPPAWMTLEVVSFGTLSRLYQLLKTSPQKKQVAMSFGIKDDEVFSNWLHAIAVWRNYCAHHSRVWNRRSVVNVKLPKKHTYSFLDDAQGSIRANKVFTILCCIKYISNIISPGSEFKSNLVSIIAQSGRLLTIQEMGFVDNWEDMDVWKLA